MISFDNLLNIANQSPESWMSMCTSVPALGRRSLDQNVQKNRKKTFGYTDRILVVSSGDGEAVDCITFCPFCHKAFNGDDSFSDSDPMKSIKCTNCIRMITHSMTFWDLYNGEIQNKNEANCCIESITFDQALDHAMKEKYCMNFLIEMAMFLKVLIEYFEWDDEYIDDFLKKELLSNDENQWANDDTKVTKMIDLLRKHSNDDEPQFYFFFVGLIEIESVFSPIPNKVTTLSKPRAKYVDIKESGYPHECKCRKCGKEIDYFRNFWSNFSIKS